MPNWCECGLTVSGDPETVLDFVKRTRNTKGDESQRKLSFHALVPQPEYMEDWYEWRMDNWGTKWEPDVLSRSSPMCSEQVTYSFWTAWCPPIYWLRAVGKLFPTLDFYLTYVEHGNQSYGIALSRQGKFQDIKKEYHITDFWDEATLLDMGYTEEEINIDVLAK